MEREELKNIERYLSGEMGDNEKLMFELRLEKDQFLREALVMQQDIESGIGLYFDNELKDKLKSQDTNAFFIDPKKQAKSRRWLVSLSIAASLLVLVSVGYFYIVSNNTPKETFYAYYQPYPNIISPVERSGMAASDELSRAMASYERGDFASAIQMFEQQTFLSAGHRFYLALSYLQLKEYTKAGALLGEVVDTADEDFYQPALWYRGLAFLASNQPESAKTIFKELAKKEESAYYRQAVNILEEL